MTQRPRAQFFLRALVVAALASATAAACTSAAPPPADPRASEVLLRYKLRPFRLTQDVALTMTTQVPGMSGDMHLDLTGVLEVSPIGSKLEVVRSVGAVRRAELSGALSPKPEDGKPPLDVAAELRSARGAEIVDVRGEVDKAATRTLADRDPDGAYDGMVAAAVKLPELPDAPLVLGTPVKVTKKETEEFAGTPIDLEVERTYTLLAFDAQTRRATVAFATASHGARELVDGSAPTFDVNIAGEGELEFDLAAQLPVRANLRSEQTISSGMVSAVFTVEVAASFTPG